MKTFNSNEEMRKQSLAEAAERAAAPQGHDADVEAYRQVMRAAAKPLPDGLPADFAAQLAAKLAATENVGLFERWVPGVGLVALALVTVISSKELLIDGGRQLAELGAGRLPWSMLCAAVLALATVGLFDRILSRQS
jgi:hypothetical protein